MGEELVQGRDVDVRVRDVASLHKLFAHILGKPYNNAIVANAALPLDLFTSTPDYAPFTYTPRTWPLACDAAATPQDQERAAQWSFDEPDEQPGLDSQVTRYMMGLDQPPPKPPSSGGKPPSR